MGEGFSREINNIKQKQNQKIKMKNGKRLNMLDEGEEERE